MNWAKELNDLYNSNIESVGIICSDKDGKNKYTLFPLYHSSAMADIEITVTENGEFVGASLIEKENRFTIIPVTEESSCRTSGMCPHPLCDNLQYLSKGIKDCIRNAKSDIGRYHAAYMAQLEDWLDSPNSHQTVRAIYQYLDSGTLLTDLLHAGILTPEEDGFLPDGTEKRFIRFLTCPDTESEPVPCWLDKSLQESYIRYYESLEKPMVLDYLTGEMQRACSLHPKKIRNDGDGAKLFSSADKRFFTFRGRFSTADEAFQIGAKSSQKLHSALNWIIRKQGKAFDSMTLVAWESSLKDVPYWDAGTDQIEDRAAVEEDADSTNARIANRFYSALYGYEKEIAPDSRMMLMVFDAATPGRLSFIEHRTMATTKYLEQIRKWHESCAWVHANFRDGECCYYVGVPGIKRIIDAVYGTEDKGVLKLRKNNLYPVYMKRLLPCVWDGKPLPEDLVTNAVDRASMPQCYNKWYNWERVLAIACSLVKKSRNERNKKEDWDMALNDDCKDRSYLYGRLLAIADRIEYQTYSKEDSKRITNAKRYMTAFYQRPYDTWRIIEQSIQPYLNKLKAPARRYYENLLDDVYWKFDESTFTDNRKLEGIYLLGFHSQSYELKKRKKEEEKTDE